MAVVDGTDGPPDHEAREQVENGCQVELPALADDQFRRIAHPALVRRIGREVLIQHIRRHGLVVVAHRGDLIPLPLAGLQALFLHQAHHAFPTHRHALLDEVFVDARAPIPLFALGKRGPHQHPQAVVRLPMRRCRARAPRVEPAPRHLEAPTQGPDRMRGLLRRDELKSHRLDLAKKASAPSLSMRRTGGCVTPRAPWHLLVTQPPPAPP